MSNRKKVYSKNTVTRPRPNRTAVIAVVVVALALVAGALGFAWTRLRSVWLEQSVLVDPVTQVEITSGKMVKADAIREAFDLRKGQNLAEIDFAAKRREALEKYPTIRAIAITREQPDKVTITVSEREPFARVTVKGRKPSSGRVVDAEGVVFPCRRGVDMLPVIKEKAGAGNGTPIGKRLEGNARAALELLRCAVEPEFQSLGINEVDASKPDILTAMLTNADRAQIAWEGMEEPSPAAHANLLVILRNLRDTRREGLTPPNTLWTATEPDRIYANTQEAIK